MAGKNTIFALETIVLTILIFIIPRVFSDDSIPIPADKSQLNSWFDANVKPLDTRKDTLDPALVAAEANKSIIKVRADGSGDFKTLTDAIKSIPEGNKRRVIISIGGGNYTEKVKIERSKPFITLYGDSKNVPNIIFNATAKEYNTVDSATVIVESEYFSAVNINFVNSAPRPDGKRELAQAAALRTGGDKASLYNCKMYGFQDTFCDDSGKHFFKDCYIEGTVDFIFGNGKSLYLNTEMHVIPGDPMAMITAHARAVDNVDSGYSFVHCMITGTGNTAYLGRAWKPFSKVVFSYTDMSDVVHPEGWSDNGKTDYDKSVYYGEYNSKGAGATMNRRAGYVKKLTDAEIKPFISLGYIEGSKWLLPPVAL
ncbi:pectinesterase 1-like [Lycium ferocissimum]|uniref:pectinesterase 1-like n=1 Tax=Lycium ferocissimum TaxID=112874 RepID=UPI002814A3F9|nr:pectinesterase 1-like [Lycium ferocissimum]